MFGKVVHKKNNDTKNGKIKTSQWFDAECKTAKKEFTKARNFYVKHKNDSNRRNFVRCRTKYNKIKCKAKKNIKFLKVKNLILRRKNNPENSGEK